MGKNKNLLENEKYTSVIVEIKKKKKTRRLVKKTRLKPFCKKPK